MQLVPITTDVSVNLDQGERVQHYVIMFVSDLRQVSSTNKTDCHDITEILLKVSLLTPSNKQTNKQTNTLAPFY
jgi:hypothetical protein